jgi:hypothetical protein
MKGAIQEGLFRPPEEGSFEVLAELHAKRTWLRGVGKLGISPAQEVSPPGSKQQGKAVGRGIELENEGELLGLEDLLQASPGGLLETLTPGAKEQAVKTCTRRTGTHF